MRRLFGRRVLVAIVLLTAVGVAFAAYSYFYTWTKYYRINPLTSFEKLKLPRTTGATLGAVVNFIDDETGELVEAVIPIIMVPFALPLEYRRSPLLFAAIPQEANASAMDVGSSLVISGDINGDWGPPNNYYEYDDDELALLNATRDSLYELGYDGVIRGLTDARITPKYHEVMHVEKKSYVNFAVSSMDIEKLCGHFAWLVEMELIFHPGSDGQLETEDDYLYSIVILPLVNPWQQPGSGFAQILLGGGDYGIIKTTFYWTKATTQEISDSFTIHIWAQEYQPTPPPS